MSDGKSRSKSNGANVFAKAISVDNHDPNLRLADMIKMVSMKRKQSIPNMSQDVSTGLTPLRRNTEIKGQRGLNTIQKDRVMQV